MVWTFATCCLTCGWVERGTPYVAQSLPPACERPILPLLALSIPHAIACYDCIHRGVYFVVWPCRGIMREAGQDCTDRCGVRWSSILRFRLSWKRVSSTCSPWPVVCVRFFSFISKGEWPDSILPSFLPWPFQLKCIRHLCSRVCA